MATSHSNASSDACCQSAHLHPHGQGHSDEAAHIAASINKQQTLFDKQVKASHEIEKSIDAVANRLLNEWEKSDTALEAQEVSHAIADGNRERILQQKVEKAHEEVGK